MGTWKEQLVNANVILASHCVVDAYGQVSMRHPEEPGRFLMSRALAPELVKTQDILEYDLDCEPVVQGGTEKHPAERFIHGGIYKARPDVMAIVHSDSHSVVPLSCTPAELAPVYHMAAFVGLGCPTFDPSHYLENSDLMVRSAEMGAHLAGTLGQQPCCLMRNHGTVLSSALP